MAAATSPSYFSLARNIVLFSTENRIQSVG